MKLLNVIYRLLIESIIQNPIINYNDGKNTIRFILSNHAEERMTRKENDSDITLEELQSVIMDALNKIEYKAFQATKRSILGPVVNGELIIKDFKGGSIVKRPGQEFFIIKNETGLQIKCKVLNFNRNQGELDIIIKTLMKSHTEKLNKYDHYRNTLHLNIIENYNHDDYLIFYV
jgi:hypothetical protein